MKNSVKNKFQKPYETLEQTPSEGLWEKISNQLPNEKEAEKRRTSAVVYWKFAAIFLLLLSIGLIFKITLKSVPIDGKETVAESGIKAKEVSKDVQKITVNQSIAEIESKVTSLTKYENQKVLNHHNQDEYAEQSVAKAQSLPLETNNSNLPNNKISKEVSVPVISPVVAPEMALNSEKIVAKKTTPPKYVSAEELLFNDELDQTRARNSLSDHGKLGKIEVENNPIRPKSLQILGITVFGED